jgi:hypothetical protein
MGNRHLYKIECFHAVGTPESEELKVTALNLFHPTTSPSFKMSVSFHIATQSQKGGKAMLKQTGVQKPRPSYCLMSLRPPHSKIKLDR